MELSSYRNISANIQPLSGLLMEFRAWVLFLDIISILILLIILFIYLLIYSSRSLEFRLSI